MGVGGVLAYIAGELDDVGNVWDSFAFDGEVRGVVVGDVMVCYGIAEQ